MNSRFSLVFVASLGFGISSGRANFHVMQVEQVIGSVEGNTSAQAIMLRLRSGGQNVVTNGQLKAYDANGANPVTLWNVAVTSPANSAAGANVLFTSTAFDSLMASVPGYSKDFNLTGTIPASYFAAGKVTWESDAGAIEWALAFGNYAGTNTGATTNTTGASGNFGAPFASGLRTTGAEGIRLSIAASALSSGNSSDYALSNPAMVRNNAGTSFTVVPEPCVAALLGVFGVGALAFWRRRA